MSAAGDPKARVAKLIGEVEALLRRRDKIGAIKAYRTATGTGLKDAKDTVDAIERAMGPGEATGVDRARPRGMHEEVLAALARWRGKPD